MTLTVGGSTLTSPQRADVRTGIGLGNVDNTSDANKPVSTATQAALNAKADAPGDLTDVVYGTSGLADGKVISYSLGGDDHTVSYPNSTTVVDVGGSATRTATLDGDGRIVSVVES